MISRVDHLQMIEDESAAFLEAVLSGSLDVPVPPCPGWTMTDLLGHLGVVQWFHGSHLDRGVTDPPPGPRPTPPADGLADWFREGTAVLLDTLRRLPPDAPAFTFDPTNDTVSFWHRRMAHEAAIHRWDAQLARNRAVGFQVDQAHDGIAEYLSVFLPRSRADDAPEGTVVLTSEEGATLSTSHGDPDAARATVVGSADELWLVVWGRQSLVDLDVEGDLDLVRSIVNR